MYNAVCRRTELAQVPSSGALCPAASSAHSLALGACVTVRVTLPFSPHRVLKGGHPRIPDEQPRKEDMMRPTTATPAARAE